MPTRSTRARSRLPKAKPVLIQLDELMNYFSRTRLQDFAIWDPPEAGPGGAVGDNG